MAESQMNASPMRAPSLHDAFTLLEGTKRWTLPGVARVTASLSSGTETMAVPDEGTETTQVSEASGEVKVALTMTTDAEWRQYQHVLTRLRRATKDGPAVFTCAHPEVRARRIKRLYFQSESLDSPYSPRDGYRVTLSFSEELKAKQKPQSVGGSDQLIIPDTPTTPAAGDQAAVKAITENTVGTPKTTRSGVNAAKAGYCSGWTWRTWTDLHGMQDDKLFGATANETEGRFRGAGQFAPWNLAAQQSLKAGDLVFYPPTKSVPQGHVGMYVGNGMVAGNNYVTYQQRGGLFANGMATGYDKAGRPVDARGLVSIGQLGTPSGIGKAQKVQQTGRVQGPAAPLPAQRPSTTVPSPRR